MYHRIKVKKQRIKFLPKNYKTLFRDNVSWKGK